MKRALRLGVPVLVGLLAIGIPARAQKLQPPLVPYTAGADLGQIDAGEPHPVFGTSPAKYSHEWHWGELVYGKTYPTKLVLGNSCPWTDNVVIRRRDLPYLSLPETVAVPPGGIEVDAVITTPPPPVIGPQPFPPPHGIWSQVNGLVSIRHDLSSTEDFDCFEGKKVYWVTGHIHYDPNPPPPSQDTPTCAAYRRLGRRPPPALNCGGESRDLAREDPGESTCFEPWSWLPTDEDIATMSELDLVAFKQRADRQLGLDPSRDVPSGAAANPGPPSEGACARFWNGGPMPALNCVNELRELALERLRALRPVAQVETDRWSWLPTEEQIAAMPELELIGFKQRADRLAGLGEAAPAAGFDPSPTVPPGACARFWSGGPMPAMSCADEMRPWAREYLRSLREWIAKGCPENPGAGPEDRTPPRLDPAPSTARVGPCAAFWDGGAMPALNCVEELRAFALDYRRNVVGPAARANPAAWTWLPAEDAIGSMSELDLVAFRGRADAQLGRRLEPRGSYRAGVETAAPGLCGGYWKGGPVPALSCRDELRVLALDYRRNILAPLADAHPDVWSWLPSEEQIAGMSEDELMTFRRRAVGQLGT